MLYTVQIQTTDADNLDGSTPLDLATAAIDTTQPGKTVVTVPTGVLLGSMDPGQVLERNRATDSGLSYTLLQCSLGGSGVVLPYTAGSLFGRQAPGATIEDTVNDLVTTGGFQTSNRFIFMRGHLLTFTTTFGAPAGPWTINLLFKPLEDADLRSAAVE